MCNRDFSSTTAALAFGAAAIGLSMPASAAVNKVGPASIPAGPFEVTPLLGFQTKYRDNIYLQEDNTTDSWIFVARPSLSAVARDRQNLYSLEYQGEAGWYDESSSRDDNDYFDNTFSGNAHMEFSERRIVELYTKYAMLHEERGTGLTEGEVGQLVDENVEYDQTEVGGSFQLGANDHARLELRAGYMEREYQNFEDITRTRDRDETTLGTTFFYPIAPKTDLLAEYTYRDIDYPNPFEVDPPLDSEENFFMVGAQWEMTPNSTSTGKLGYIDKSFDDSARDDWDGLGWSLELRMQPRVQDTVVVSTQRKPEETTREGNFADQANLSVKWTHQWSDRVYSILGTYYARDKYEDSFNDRDDDIYNVSVRGGYQFRRWVSLYGEYRYDEKDSNVDTLSYEDNTFIIGVEFSL
jgi:hypothetical protein